MPKTLGKKKYQKYSSWWRLRGGKTVIAGITGLLGVLACLFTGCLRAPSARAASCPELLIVFARGSGSEVGTNDNFLEFRDTIEQKIGDWGIGRQYIDLNYEARGIDVNNLSTLIGAFFGAGDTYEFGRSVDDGVEKLARLASACPDSRFVLGGYSQGAMVVSQAIHSLSAKQIVYAATFGDPKIYLPEGKAFGALNIINSINGASKNFLRTGIIPEACSGKNLSEYRMYVPDCYAYEGMLGSYKPYQPLGYSGKLGTWCNKYDMFCSSYLSIGSHTSYVSDGLYEDASRVIANKIAMAFGTKNRYRSPHDTAILIDSTGSMNDLIDKYRQEALKLAEKTLASGGRVALYDYRDVADNYEPREWCNFETCTLESLKAGLDAIEVDGGGDDPESLLSASFKVMKKLQWKYGSTKSVVVLTDAGYHQPDLDGTTFEQVVALSKSIDPVNFYIITPSGVMNRYTGLADYTGGLVVNSASDLALLTDTITERFDSLPRVEEVESWQDLPEISEVSSEVVALDRVKVSWQSTGTRTMLILNDAVLGITEQNEIVLEEVDFSVTNKLRIVPLSDTRRGDGVEIELVGKNEGGLSVDTGSASFGIVVPKAPNTGRLTPQLVNSGRE
ncbi:MAG: cutinase family protein [Candidatus Saccharibacteria bacterium]|nr:cutinase family protein [Candidatus Saccharibacteria bacterium]